MLKTRYGTTERRKQQKALAQRRYRVKYPLRYRAQYQRQNARRKRQWNSAKKEVVILRLSTAILALMLGIILVV